MDEEMEELFGSNEVEIERSVSYSRLSDFDRNGPKALIKKSDPNSYGIKIGSIVDDLTLPKPDFDFKTHYIIYDGEKPTATLGKLVDIILNNYNSVPTTDEILEICKNNDFWKRSKDETIIKNFDNPEFFEYLKIQLDPTKRNVITTNEYMLSQELSDVLRTHQYSKHIFNSKRYINQLSIKYTYKGLRFRGILDRVNIDDENKTVRFIDLKTGQDEALNFTKSFIKYRYYLQEAVYAKAFKLIAKDLGLEGYKLLPFQFLYIGRTERIPIMFTISKKWHKAALNGFTTDYGTNYKGLETLIDDIKWHWDNKVFDMPREIYESEGVINLNDTFIKI